MKQEESFGIIPFRLIDGEWHAFIILHKFGKHWGFPKGKREINETSLDTAKRELHEETGLKVEKLFSEVPLQETYHYYRRGGKVQKTSCYFPALVSGALLLQMDEIADGKWISVNDVEQALTFDQAKRIFEDAKKHLPDEK